MDPLTVSVASGLRSRMESLDMLANNLANASTSGFKKDSESYSLYMSAAALDAGADEDPVTAALPVIDKQWTDFSQGVLQDTGGPLDLAISGDGFFAVEGKAGPLYTRNGRFRLTADGSVVTAEGQRLRTVGGGTLQAQSTAPMEISPQGVVTQGGLTLGRIEVVRFNGNGSLVKAGASTFSAAEPAQPAEEAEVIQGKLEGSNVNTSESAVRMINVMRQFEMLIKASLINAEMSRKSVEEVAKPS